MVRGRKKPPEPEPPARPGGVSTSTPSSPTTSKRSANDAAGPSSPSLNASAGSPAINSPRRRSRRWNAVSTATAAAASTPTSCTCCRSCSTSPSPTSSSPHPAAAPSCSPTPPAPFPSSTPPARHRTSTCAARRTTREIRINNPDETDPVLAAVFGSAEQGARNWHQSFRTWRKKRLREVEREYGDRLDEVAAFLRDFATKIEALGPRGYLDRCRTARAKNPPRRRATAYRRRTARPPRAGPGRRKA